MTFARLGIAIVTPISLYLSRCMILWLFRRAWPVFMGIAIPPYDYLRHLRFLGWDLSATSVLLFTGALISKSSRFGKFQTSCPAELQPIIIIAFFLGFLAPYSLAVCLRYGVMEITEQDPKRRWLGAAPSWFVGGLLICATASAILER